jgi:citrate/tricarballylate utilization protein
LSGLDALLEEGARQFSICNACRYCEGYCAVFPAMERRIDFTAGDLSQLAHLCHDCRACYQACMYTEPHEFAVNIPLVMSEARVESFEHFARPRVAGAVFHNGPLTLAAVTVAAIVVITAIFELVSPTPALFGSAHGPGSLYRTVSHVAMMVPAMLLTAFAASVALAGFGEYLREAGHGAKERLTPAMLVHAISEALTLRWLDGGGGDCYYPDPDMPSPELRVAHHLLVLGLLSAFAATTSAAFAEYVLGEQPPYGLLSVPVILGTVGGVAVVISCAGLLIRNRLRTPALATRASERGDAALLISLMIVAVTGIVLLIVQKATGEVRIVLLIHLGAVAGLYLFAPYGKLMHAVYRLAAIVVDVRERAASP